MTPIASSLSFTFVANACGIFTGSNGSRLLCDPWLNDGVFEGSWCHFPKLQTRIEDVQDVDAIYISHLHPDHFDERFFNFNRSTPLIVLDHGPNFLIKNLQRLGFENLVRIKDGETVRFQEFDLTMFSPFAKHNFHEAAVGNLIDSALHIACEGVSALNANDNTLSREACERLTARFGEIGLAMLNYNAAGPYPSCFDNLSLEEKKSEHERILNRNFSYMRELVHKLQPRAVLPFAGAYVLGGDLHEKNAYLGTTTWDKCAAYLRSSDIGSTKVVVLREGDTLNIATLEADRPYVPIDVVEMQNYISNELAQRHYPYQLDATPDKDALVADIELASSRMKERMHRFNIDSTFRVLLKVFDSEYQIYPSFQMRRQDDESSSYLKCSMDERLLRRILNRKAHWNNAEIGAHISFVRVPNQYEPDLHTGLQFFHV